MHFVLKVVISQHEISWRRSGISHWSEMMMLVVDIVVLWLYFWKMFYNIWLISILTKAACQQPAEQENMDLLRKKVYILKV